MGYHTRFYVSATDEYTQPVLEWLSEESAYHVDELQGVEPIKWYCQHEDCVDASKQFPETTIRVEGSGEEDGDLWVKWYRNGKHVACHLKLQLPLGNEPPGGWDQQQLEPAKCWVGVQNSGRRWYFDTQAELDAEQSRGGAFVRTFSMTEDFR